MDARRIAELEALCRSSDPDDQVQGVLGLQDEDATGSTDAILPLLRASDPVVRMSAAEALGWLGGEVVEKVGPPLVGALQDTEAIVRAEAAEALGVLQFPPALTGLVAALEDDDAMVRASAAEALGNLGDAQALDALQARLSDEDAPVRAFAVNAMGLLGGPADLGRLEAARSRESSSWVVGEILLSRYRFGAREALDQALALLLEDEEVASALLNGFEDLIARRPPEWLAEDSGHLRSGLDACAAARPDLAGHVERLKRRLRES